MKYGRQRVRPKIASIPLDGYTCAFEEFYEGSFYGHTCFSMTYYRSPTSCLCVSSSTLMSTLEVKLNIHRRSKDHYSQTVTATVFIFEPHRANTSSGIFDQVTFKPAWTGPDSSVGRVSAPENGRSRVRSRAATYQSRKKWYWLLLAWHSDLRGRAKTGRPSVRIM